MPLLQIRAAARSKFNFILMVSVLILFFVPRIGLATQTSVKDVFDFENANTNFQFPESELLPESDNRYYGASDDGAGEAIYEMNLKGRGKVLHKFKYSEAYNINPVLTKMPDGSIYGTAFAGGAYQNGSVFRLDSTNVLTVVHSFSQNGAEGDSPYAGLLLASDGLLYGVAPEDGSQGGGGTLYRINPADGSFEVIHYFQYGSKEGSQPTGDLVQAADGTIYGTATGGGKDQSGVIFKLTPDGAVTPIASFSPSLGCTPFSGLTDGQDGWFYGTTGFCGAYSLGTIYRFNAEGVIQKLYDLTTADSNFAFGLSPRLRLGSDGKLYGVFVHAGDDRAGLAYRIDKEGNFTALHLFTSAEGCGAVAGLIETSPGHFLGPLRECGPNSRGADYVSRPG